MSIDHGKVLALANRVSMLRVEEGCISDIEERDAIERELRALAQPAEAVESPWIADLRNEAVRGSMKDVYWLSRDQVFELIGDAAGRKSPAHHDVVVTRPTDAAQGAVSPEELRLYVCEKEARELERTSNASQVVVTIDEPLDFPWIIAALGWIEQDDGFSRVTRRLAAGQRAALTAFYTHPQAAPSQTGWLHASIIREAGDVLEAVGASGVSLPDNWRWPLADELHGIAAMAAAPAQGDDSRRLDWLDANEAEIRYWREDAGDDEYLIWCTVVKGGKSISGHPLATAREAIDAAIAAAPSQEGES